MREWMRRGCFPFVSEPSIVFFCFSFASCWLPAPMSSGRESAELPRAVWDCGVLEKPDLDALLAQTEREKRGGVGSSALGELDGALIPLGFTREDWMAWATGVFSAPEEYDSNNSSGDSEEEEEERQRRGAGGGGGGGGVFRRQVEGEGAGRLKETTAKKYWDFYMRAHAWLQETPRWHPYFHTTRRAFSSSHFWLSFFACRRVWGGETRRWMPPAQSTLGKEGTRVLTLSRFLRFLRRQQQQQQQQRQQQQRGGRERQEKQRQQQQQGRQRGAGVVEGEEAEEEERGDRPDICL